MAFSVRTAGGGAETYNTESSSSSSSLGLLRDADSGTTGLADSGTTGLAESGGVVISTSAGVFSIDHHPVAVHPGH